MLEQQGPNENSLFICQKPVCLSQMGMAIRKRQERSARCRETEMCRGRKGDENKNIRYCVRPGQPAQKQRAEEYLLACKILSRSRQISKSTNQENSSCHHAQSTEGTIGVGMRRRVGVKLGLWAAVWYGSTQQRCLD